MKKWYYYENDDVIGPFSEEELIEHISPETLLCPAGEEDWKPANEYPGIKRYLDTDDPDSQETSQKPPRSELQLPETQSPARETDKNATEHTKTEPRGDNGESQPDERSEETLQPTLETLTRIAREANAEDLLREFKHHWDEYDREEQKIIYLEMKHLGILPDQQNP